ncbi:MAG: cytochrome c4 [Rhodanobacter sp.]|jgi:cytochrome c553|nr:cytochrome c4 [Rhodanobacter sp.]
MKTTPLTNTLAALLLIAAGATARAADTVVEHRVNTAVSTRAGVANLYDMRRIEPIRGDAAAGAAKVTICVACHGPQGNSVVPLFPQLAGQRAEYLYGRLLDFQDADEKLPYYTAVIPMPQQAREMSDTDLRDIAVYFAAQVPEVTLPPTLAANIHQGEELYLHGDSERGIPPCQGCHGAYGEGGPVDAGSQYLAYPALHGQHAVFMTDRLRNYRENGGWPHFSTDDKIMHSVAKTLSDQDISAITNYLAWLAPTSSR